MTECNTNTTALGNIENNSADLIKTNANTPLAEKTQEKDMEEHSDSNLSQSELSESIKIYNR